MNEFNLIKTYFKDKQSVRKDVLIGIGDDAAITSVADKQMLATTTDTLVEGVHFLAETKPEAIASKAIAVNLSDLAAMGAEPCWISLSLSLPELNEQWLQEFSDQLAYLCDYYSVQLIGGDTVKGPLSITITAQGVVPEESVLKRDSAQAGDWLYVTGSLGDAAAGLDILQNNLNVVNSQDRQYLIDRHLRPTPRILAGTGLRRLASACIDVSDGLLQDLNHIMSASDVGAIVHLDKLPLSNALGNNVKRLERALDLACFGGDDYELLFTVSEELKTSMQSALESFGIDYTLIGQITGSKEKLDLRLNDQPFEIEKFQKNGYLHF